MGNEQPVKLTIAIPTFNRAAYLAKLLEDLAAISLGHDCEVLVIDNASGDATPKVTAQYRGVPGFRFERNAFNLGIEGNIIKALSEGRGQYTWLLSDHMRLEQEGVKLLLESLRQADEIELGYVRIRDYGTVVGSSEPRTLASLTKSQRAKLVFYTSNISGLLVSTDLVRRSIRPIYRMAGHTYPHLGIYFQLGNSDRIVEFPECSSFQSGDRKQYTISYDTFCSRFVEYLELLSGLGRDNPELDIVNLTTEVKEFRSALHGEILKRLVSPGSVLASNELVRCLKVYRGRYLLIFTALWLGGWLPLNWRKGATLALLKAFFPSKHAQVMSPFQGNR